MWNKLDTAPTALPKQPASASATPRAGDTLEPITLSARTGEGFASAAPAALRLAGWRGCARGVYARQRHVQALQRSGATFGASQRSPAAAGPGPAGRSAPVKTPGPDHGCLRLNEARSFALLYGKVGLYASCASARPRSAVSGGWTASSMQRRGPCPLVVAALRITASGSVLRPADSIKMGCIRVSFKFELTQQCQRGQRQRTQAGGKRSMKYRQGRKRLQTKSQTPGSTDAGRWQLCHMPHFTR